MSRFQAPTNNVLDAELEMLREQLGLLPNQKADLLREVVSLAAWVVRQAVQGRSIEARRGGEVAPLVHPAIERLQAKGRSRALAPLVLSEAEVGGLTSVLNHGFDPSPGLRKALANLANPKRRPPRLRWKKSAS
jgi:hypothetical protein